MTVKEKIAQRLVPEAAVAHRLRSVQVAGVGAVAGAVASGLAASGAAASWLGAIPTWAVYLGGAVICALTVIARLWRQNL